MSWKKPPRLGVYSIALYGHNWTYYSYWNGEKFGWVATSQSEAYSMRESSTSQPGQQTWHGNPWLPKGVKSTCTSTSRKLLLVLTGSRA